MSNIINTEEQVVIWRPRVEITQSEQQYEKKKLMRIVEEIPGIASSTPIFAL